MENTGVGTPDRQSKFKESALQILSILLAVSMLGPLLQILRFAIYTTFSNGVPILMINSFNGLFTYAAHFAIPLIPALVFFRLPRVAIPTYAIVYFAYSEWTLSRSLERNFRSSEDFPFSDRWFNTTLAAVIAGCALLLAYWLLNKYSNRFKVRIV